MFRGLLKTCNVGGGIVAVLSAAFVLSFADMVFAEVANAHERWVLSADQMQILNQQPKPEIYTAFTFQGTIILLVFGALLAGLIYFHYFRHPANWLVLMSGKLRRRVNWIQPILRVTLAWSLIMSALGLCPRLGNALFAYPTFIAPDLEIYLVTDYWRLMVWFELMLGVWFFFGMWTRVAASFLFVAIHFALLMYGEPFLAYYPTFLGISLYLIIRGGGEFCISLPVLNGFQDYVDRLAAIPVRHAQFILRVLAGFNFLYLGVWFKILQPNLAIGILKIYEVPILHWAPEAFTLVMACVEILAGIVIMAGILIRPCSLFLFVAFFFFATFLPEGYDAHMVFYGVLLAFLFGGPGRVNAIGIYQRKKDHEYVSKRIEAIIN